MHELLGQALSQAIKMVVRFGLYGITGQRRVTTYLTTPLLSSHHYIPSRVNLLLVHQLTFVLMGQLFQPGIDGYML